MIFNESSVMMMCEKAVVRVRNTSMNLCPDRNVIIGAPASNSTLAVIRLVFFLV